MTIKRLLFLTMILLLALPVAVFSQKSKKGKKKDALEAADKTGLDLELEKSDVFQKGFTGFSLFDPEKGETLYEYNAGHYFTPASNTKIFTLYTSLRLLGDSIPALQYKQEGDLLLLWGTGDPSFLYPHLQQNPAVFNFLKNRKEQLVFCPANWKDDRYGNGWMWGDYPYNYQVEKSPFPVYGNAAHFVQGDSTNGIETLPSFLKNHLRPDATLDVRDYIGRVEFDNLFTFNTLAEAGKKFELDVPFHYEPSFLADLLTDTLKRPVHVLDAPLLPTSDTKIIYSLQADSLYQLMMQESDNFIAEQLLLVCSWQKYRTLNSKQVIDFSTTSLLGDLPDSPQWVDGSGLSRYNLFTPRSIVKLLEKIYRTVPQERLFGIFPAGGESGTIKSYYRNGGEPYVFAKTGTLRNNHCLSGYLVTKKGKVLIFSFMHNNYTLGMSVLKKEMEQVLKKIHEAF